MTSCSQGWLFAAGKFLLDAHASIGEQKNKKIGELESPLPPIRGAETKAGENVAAADPTISTQYFASTGSPLDVNAYVPAKSSKRERNGKRVRILKWETCS